MVSVFLRAMTLNPYPSVQISAKSVLIPNSDNKDFEVSDNKGKAKIILSALKTERDREDALALWLNDGKLKPSEVKELRYGVEEGLAADAAAEAEAMTELLDAGYDVEEEPEPEPVVELEPEPVVEEKKPKKTQRKSRSKKDDEVL